MTSKPEISVIVPVYNVEKYLERCVKSVLEQTFSDFELILVDDCSPDKSGILCDELEKTDERIKVIHRIKNGGLSAARNSGIDIIKGEYVFFLDSDDFLHKDALKTVYSDICSFDADIAVMEAVSVSMEAMEAPECITGETTVLSGREALIKKQAQSANACGKLFKSSLFAEFRFIEGRWHEDVHMSCRMFSKEGIRVAFNDKKLYCYRENPKSFMRSKMSAKKIDDALFIFEDRVNFFASKNDEELRTIAARKHLYRARDCYFGAKEDICDKERMKLSHESFNRVFKTVDKNAFDKDTYKLFKAFSKNPDGYLNYEKRYWFIKGIKHGITRRVKGK